MLGLSTTALDGEFEAWIEKVKNLGFEFIEFVSEWPQYLTHENYRHFAEVIESSGLKLSIHAPFSDVNIGAFSERIRRAFLEVLRETLEVAAQMNATVVTIHPGHCSPLSIKHRDRYLEIHRESLHRIANWGEELGIRIGVENMPRFPILDAQSCDRLAELVEGIEIGVTFDVGHLNTTTANFDRFLELLGDRVVHIHLHDNLGERDEHLPLGDGAVPWEKLLPKLPKVTKALEVADIKSAGKSLKFLKSLH